MPNAPYPLDFETQNLEDESKKLQEMLSFYENAKNEQEGAQAVTDALKAAFGSIGFEGVSEPPPPERDDPEVSPEPEPASLDDAARAAAALEEAEAAEAGVREERAAADAMARTVAAGLDAPEAAPKPSEMKQAVASTRAWAEGQRPKKPLTPAQRQKREELFLAAQKAKDMARGEGTSRPSQPKTRKPKSLSRDYEKWDGFDDFSDGDEAWQGTLPLASTYGKWDAYDGESSDDDAPARDAHGYDKLWCPVHNVSHYGECEKCVAARGGTYEPVLAPKAYVPRRDPKDVDAAMESMETKVKDHARAKDVLHQLKAKIDGIPDDEVSIRGCLEAIKIAGAYSPKDATIHQLLKPPDEQPPRPQGPLPEGK